MAGALRPLLLVAARNGMADVIATRAKNEGIGVHPLPPSHTPHRRLYLRNHVPGFGDNEAVLRQGDRGWMSYCHVKHADTYTP